MPDDIAQKFRAMPADMGTSILADRVADRPLEWDVRNGVIARLGRAHGLPTPISDVLVPLSRGRERPTGLSPDTPARGSPPTPNAPMAPPFPAGPSG